MNSTVRCPKCGTTGAVPQAYLGKRIHCAKCKKEFKAAPTDPNKARRAALALCWVAAVVIVAVMVWPQVRQSRFWQQTAKHVQNFASGLKNDNRQNEQTDKQLFPVGNPIAQDNDQPPTNKLFPNQKIALAVGPDAAIETTVAKLVDAFKNEIAGQDKYGDKRVRITGFITSGALFTNFLKDVEKKEADDQTPKIFCFFTKAYRGNQTLEDIGRIKVTVEGTCVGYHYGGLLALKDCSLVSGWDDLRSKKQQQVTQDQEAKVLAAEKLEQEIRVSAAVSSPQAAKEHDITEVIGTVRNIFIITVYNEEIPTVAVIPDEAIQYVEIVNCKFRHVYRPQLMKLRTGDHVVIRGKVSDWTGGGKSHLTHCVLMK